jgi:hypothetical protein
MHTSLSSTSFWNIAINKMLWTKIIKHINKDCVANIFKALYCVILQKTNVFSTWPVSSRSCFHNLNKIAVYLKGPCDKILNLIKGFWENSFLNKDDKTLPLDTVFSVELTLYFVVCAIFSAVFLKNSGI